MKIINKKLVIVVILIGILSSIFIWQNISDKETKLEMVSLNNETKQTNMFAIMLEEIDEEGNSTYVESENNVWPTDDTYVYDITKSGCIDTNGNKIENALEYDVVNNIASVKTEKTSYCYLYFSKPINLYELCEGTENMSDCLSEKEEQVYMVNNVTDEITGGMYRYQGTKDKVIDNYICFGTNDTAECLSNTDKYLYRILGFDSNGYLKLIKNTALETQYTRGSSAWGTSTLYTGLNDSYFLNAVDENSERLYIPTDWEDKIVNWNWKYGSVTTSQYYLPELTYVYNLEYSFVNYVTNKIGLMYIHDYYIGSENICANGTNVCVNSWLNNEINEWLLTHWNSDTAWTIQEGSGLWAYWWGGSYFARPVFYLDNTIKISNSDGTIENPYIIE